MEFKTAVVVRTIILIEAFCLFITSIVKLVYEKTRYDHVGHLFLFSYCCSFIRFADLKERDEKKTTFFSDCQPQAVLQLRLQKG